MGGAGSVLNARSSRHALLSGKAAKLPRFAASLLVAVVEARCETRCAWALHWLRTACVHREVGTRLLPATLRHLVRGQAAVRIDEVERTHPCIVQYTAASGGSRTAPRGPDEQAARSATTISRPRIFTRRGRGMNGRTSGPPSSCSSMHRRVQRRRWADSARDDLVDHWAPVGWHGVRPLLACGYFALSGRDEVLPEPLYDCALLCRACRGVLLYQRQERPRFPRHFCRCRRCGRRYSFGEPPWSPSDSRSGGSNDPRSAPI